jgi:hypothetical protein
MAADDRVRNRTEAARDELNTHGQLVITDPTGSTITRT